MSISSLSQPNADFDGTALYADIAKVFRMDGTINMTVKDNVTHTGSTLTVAFWLKLNTLPETLDQETIFLSRSVEEFNNNCNYLFRLTTAKKLAFTVSAKNASTTTARGSTVTSDPIEAGVWYLVAGVIDVEATTPTVKLFVFKQQLDEYGELDYTNRKSYSKTFTSKNGTITGEKGNLVLGLHEAEGWATGLVMDVDNLYIWSDAKSITILDLMLSGMGSDGFNANMVSKFSFDDGGKSAEDFMYPQDWMTAEHESTGFTKADWKHAGVLNKDSEPSTEEVLGCGMVIDRSLADLENDTDHDGLPDDWELYFLGSLEYDGNDDPDEDGLTNMEEYMLSSDYRDPELGDNPSYDTENAWMNPMSPDTDGDDMADGWEHQYNLNPLDSNDAFADADEDGLANVYEKHYGTDPQNPDTDGDGLPDGWEVKYINPAGVETAPSLDPLSAEGDYGANGDPDGDGFTNIEEYTYGSNPIVFDGPDKDTDRDGLSDQEERENGVWTDPALTDTDDDEFDDYQENAAGTDGYNSLSKPTISSTVGKGFNYDGNLVANFKYDKVLTVPEGADNWLGYASWTVEARFRICDLPINTGDSYRVYLVRRSFSASDYTNDAQVTDADAYNYAIGFKVDAKASTSDTNKIYPFVAWKAKDNDEKYVGTDEISVPMSMTLTSEGQRSDWIFVTGVYDSVNRRLYLYVNGELKHYKTFDAATSAGAQCPTEAAKLGKSYKSYFKLGENASNGSTDSTAYLQLDEVRVWGIKPNTIALYNSSDYLNAYVRSADEIADGAARPITPVRGVFDAGISARYQTITQSGLPVRDNPHTYELDKRVSDTALDSTWTTKAGSIGTRVLVSYHDQNDNGYWDPGEDIWRDRSVAQARDEDSQNEDFDETQYLDADDTKVITNVYNEGYDVMLAKGYNGWVAGTAYTRSVTTTTTNNGTTTTSTSSVSVTAEQSAQGKTLELFYVDKNGNGVIDAEDDFWQEYYENYETYYLPSVKHFADRMGLALYLRFDDAGGSIEDFAWHADWRSTPVWKHAIRPTGLQGAFPPKAATAKAGVDYALVTSENSYGFTWVTEAVAAPTSPAIEIQTLSDVRDENGNITNCYIPADAASAENADEFDILTAVVTGESTDPEGSNVTYQYYWLKNVDPATVSYEDGELKVNGQAVQASMLLSTDKELDLFNYKDKLAAGDEVSLIAVAVSDSGKASEPVTTTVTVSTSDEFMPPPVLLLTKVPNDEVKLGATISVTVQIDGTPVVGDSIILEWYRNGVIYNSVSKTVEKATTKSYTFDMKLTDDRTKNGDVWHFKAYYKSGSDNARSRAVPPTEEYNNFVYTLVGEPYDGEVSEDGSLAGNRAPRAISSVTISPEKADTNTILIAKVTGGDDPDGDRTSYHYQWYENGQPIQGATLPYYPGTLTATEITSTTSSSSSNTTTSNDITTVGDGETTGIRYTLTTTSLSSGSTYSVEVYSQDIYGSQSTHLFSDGRYVYSDLADLYNESEVYAYENNDIRARATRILPKEDWWDFGDANVQTHYFHTTSDVDWFWFIVPYSMNELPKRVRFETNYGEADQMYSDMHQMVNDGTLDTQLVLYNEAGKAIWRCDDYGNPDGFGGTKYARFERILEPGIYYVQVSLATSGMNYVSTTPYCVHLGIDEQGGSVQPSAPEVAYLTPAAPGTTEDLVCEADGSVSQANGGVEYYYVWFCNGELVPFGAPAEPTEWNDLNRYWISQAKNHLSSSERKKYGAPNTIPAAYTLPGQTWFCVVYAHDVNGFSGGVMTNSVTIQSSTWGMQLNVQKTYKGSVEAVTGSQQAVTIGWADNATFAFDPSYDSALPQLVLPPVSGSNSVSYSPQGRMYSIGLDNEETELSTDIRPYGRASSWFIKIEVGDDSAERVVLSWQPGVDVPTDSVDGLKITRMRQTANGTFEAINGSTVDMTSFNNITLTDEDIAKLQRDENGQRYVVFRVSLGAPDSMQQIILLPGWNMVGISVNPLNNQVSDVFSNGSTQYYRGAVYEYKGGQYLVAN